MFARFPTVVAGFACLALAASTALGDFQGTLLDENFDTFTPGVFPQNGWTGSIQGNFDFFDMGDLPISTFPLSGVAWQVIGDGSDESRQGFSPWLAAPIFGRLDFDLLTAMTQTQFALSVQPTVEPGHHRNTTLRLLASGGIDVLQWNPATSSSEWFPSTGAISNLVPTRLGIEVLADGTLNVYQDNNLIFTGLDANYAITGTAVGMANFLVFVLNHQDGAGDRIWLDNFVTPIPEPATLAFTALAGLALLRRRT